jgi:lauroyl/myristoyl acyltransferase
MFGAHGPRAVLLPRLVRLMRRRVPVPWLVARRRQIGWTLAHAPGLRRRVEAAMTAALGPDGFTPVQVDAYFHHLADLAVFSAVAYTSGIHSDGLKRHWPDTRGPLDPYHRALARGRGALMVCPHLIGHELLAGAASAELPVTFLARRSAQPEYAALKAQWYAALGVEVVYRSRRGADAGRLAEMTAAVRTLRSNRVLAVTPDLIRRRGTGVTVQLFGRDADLPIGAFYLAARVGAPLLCSFLWEADGRYWARTDEPMEIGTTGDRDRDVQMLAQEWATRFERFVRAHPDMWQFWLDKRWRRWLTQAAPAPAVGR